MVKKIRKIEIMLGTPGKKILQSEKNVRDVSRKSIVTRRSLKKNYKIKLTDISFKRPGTGISPMDFKKVLGKRIKIKVEKNKILKLKNIY